MQQPRGLKKVVGGQKVTVCRQTAANFQQRTSCVLKLSILSVTSPALNFQTHIFIFKRKHFFREAIIVRALYNYV